MLTTNLKLAQLQVFCFSLFWIKVKIVASYIKMFSSWRVPFQYQCRFVFRECFEVVLHKVTSYSKVYWQLFFWENTPSRPIRALTCAFPICPVNSGKVWCEKTDCWAHCNGLIWLSCCQTEAINKDNKIGQRSCTSHMFDAVAACGHCWAKLNGHVEP